MLARGSYGALDQPDDEDRYRPDAPQANHKHQASGPVELVEGGHREGTGHREQVVGGHGGTIPEAIHQSAWKGNSRNFAYPKFSEVRQGIFSNITHLRD